MIFENEKKLKILLDLYDNSPMGVAVVYEKDDKSYPIKFINKAVLEIFGYETYGEILGKNLNILIHPKDRKQHDIYVKEWFSAPYNLELNKRVGKTIGTSKDGDEVHLGICIRPYEVIDEAVDLKKENPKCDLFGVAYIFALDSFASLL